MSKLSDIEHLNVLLSGSRERATQTGDYQISIEEHDQVIRLCTKIQKSCESSDSRKLEGLKDRCRAEVKILQDLVHELNELKHTQTGNRTNNDNSAADDPDVWPPPTPAAGGRRNPPPLQQDDNLPSWARNPGPNPNFPNRPEPSQRRVNDDNSRNDNGRMRPKDPVPVNRRRCVFKSIDII
jgi:hypothetical protein